MAIRISRQLPCGSTLLRSGPMAFTIMAVSFCIPHAAVCDRRLSWSCESYVQRRVPSFRLPACGGRVPVPVVQGWNWKLDLRDVMSRVCVRPQRVAAPRPRVRARAMGTSRRRRWGWPGVAVFSGVTPDTERRYDKRRRGADGRSFGRTPDTAIQTGAESSQRPSPRGGLGI